MTQIAEVIQAWNEADPAAIHPTRGVSEEAYGESGEVQAGLLATILPEGGKVVDFGCGDGRVAIPLFRRGFRVTAADGSEAMLRRFRERANSVPTVLTDGTDLYEKLGHKTDAVVSLAVLIHHDYASGERIVEGLRAAVRVNGLLILDWPTSEQPTEGETWISVTTWSRDQQDELCQRIGLKRVDSELPWPVFRAVKAA